MASVGVTWCGTALVGVRWPRWIWHGLCGSSMTWVGVAWPQWVWNGFSGCVYDSEGVACP